MNYYLSRSSVFAEELLYLQPLVAGVGFEDCGRVWLLGTLEMLQMERCRPLRIGHLCREGLLPPGPGTGVAVGRPQGCPHHHELQLVDPIIFQANLALGDSGPPGVVIWIGITVLRARLLWLLGRPLDHLQLTLELSHLLPRLQQYLGDQRVQVVVTRDLLELVEGRDGVGLGAQPGLLAGGHRGRGVPGQLLQEGEDVRA